jgi:hypothetical protein
MHWPKAGWPDVALLLTIAVHVVVRALYADFVPVFDSRLYFDTCLARYFEAPLEPLRLNCFGHPSLAFMAVVALGQVFDLGNVYLLHASTTALGVASIVAFHLLCARLLSGPELLWERRLLVAGYGLGAQCLAVGVNFNPDYGVLTFFLLAFERLLAGSFRLAALFGACLLFSKEPGLLLYGVAASAYALFTWIRPRAPRAEWQRAALWLAAPVALFVAVKLYERLSGVPVVWGGDRTFAPVLAMFTSFSLLDPVFLTYAFDILGLGFAWILGLPLLIFAARGALYALFDRPRRAAPGFDPRLTAIVLTVFALSFLLLTRFKTYNNVRYFGVLAPLLLVSAGYALHGLGFGAAVRRLLLGLSLAFGFSFNFHSLDPISQGYFGTFAFGRHELLRTNAFDPCCGYGRDQLVYNLQFTALHGLQNAAYAALRPGPDTVLVAADQVDYHLSGRVDDQTFERTLRSEGSHEITLVGVSALLERSVLPGQLYFLVFPNADNRPAYAILGRHYREIGRQTFRDGGYELLVHALERK